MFFSKNDRLSLYKSKWPDHVVINDRKYNTESVILRDYTSQKLSKRLSNLKVTLGMKKRKLDRWIMLYEFEC